MPNQYHLILSEIAGNPWTALIITIDGTVARLIPLESAPTAPLVQELTGSNAECAVQFVERKEMRQSELEDAIASAVEGLKLNRAGKLKPGANIVKQ